MPKFEEFSEDELKQLGQGDEQPEDDELESEEEEPDDQEEADQEAEGEEEEAEGEEEEEGDSEEEKPVKKVDLRALHAERGERKRAESERDELRDRYTRLETRLEMILEGMKKAEPEEDPMPDKAVDPIGYIEWQDRRIAKLEGKFEETDKKTAEQTEQQRQQQAIDQAISYGNTLAQQVRAKNPVMYDEALKFTVTRRAGELRLLGVDEAKIPNQINLEMQSGMLSALRREINPGDFLIKYAKAQGFVYKKPEGGEEEEEGGEKKNGKSVKEILHAKKLNKTLGDGGNASKGGGSTKGLAKALADMDDAEFADWYAKNSKGGKNKEFANAFRE